MGQSSSILVVDDDDTLLAFMQDALSGEYQVSTASDCIEATDLLNEHCFALLIVELLLPVVDGAEFIRMVRADHTFDDLTVLVVTDYAWDSQVSESLRVGGILYKPFALAELVRIVAKLVRRAPPDSKRGIETRSRCEGSANGNHPPRH